jgi:hypothetical protein
MNTRDLKNCHDVDFQMMKLFGLGETRDKRNPLRFMTDTAVWRIMTQRSGKFMRWRP